jgi:hypothetical protein
MRLPNYFRQLARRCLGFSKTAVEPEVIEQMQVWAVDLAEEADQAERRDRQTRTAQSTRRRGTGIAGYRLRSRSRVH